MRPRTTITVAGFATALALATAGCSGSSTSPSAAPTSTVGPTSTPGPTASPPSRQRTTPSPSATPSSAPATEFNPPGDIPDNQVFVDYSVPGSRVQIQVPEGWARSTSGGQVTFSDHFNSIGIQVQPMAAQPTVASVRHTEVPALAKSTSKFALTGVSTVQRQHGSAVLVTYQQDSQADPVTGKVVRDAVERYDFWSHGQEAILTLTGPSNADNVDPWRKVSDSLLWK